MYKETNLDLIYNLEKKNLPLQLQGMHIHRSGEAASTIYHSTSPRIKAVAILIEVLGDSIMPHYTTYPSRRSDAQFTAATVNKTYSILSPF